ncbi:MAG: SAM-dependent methyltransferase [Acidimicrobiales bacterium]
MAADPSTNPAATKRDPIEIDITVAHVARAYDYMLGGVTNFEVDRQAAERLSAVFPGGVETARVDVRAQRDFLGRAVRYLVGEAGIRQFLDVGTGIPNADNVHAIAQETAPDCRIVYVDRDPIVLAHAHTLLVSTTEGATDFVDGDLRNPDDILRQAAITLDLRQPVALVLVGILHVIRDEDDPQAIVTQLMEALPSDSYLVISHLPEDMRPDEMAKMAERSRQMMREPFIMRSYDEVLRFFDGLDLVEPGLVQVDQWTQDRPPPPPPPGTWVTPLYAAVGRKD